MAKKTIYDLKDEIVNENNEIDEIGPYEDLEEVVVVKEAASSVKVVAVEVLYST